jgi:hypothetical protein
MQNTMEFAAGGVTITPKVEASSALSRNHDIGKPFAPQTGGST